MTSDNRKSLSKAGSRLRRTRKGRGLPRIMWVAIAVCIIGAVLIFRDQGGNVPTGIGEYQTVVTAPEGETTLQQEMEPRSGDVDINDQTRALTPEKPSGAAADPVAEPAPAQEEAKQAAPKTAPKTVAKAPEVQLVKPSDNGPYLVQTGSFGDAANADKEADRLKALGFDAGVKVGNTAEGSLFYRVRIGYFKSRSEAEAFIRQNRKIIPGAIPTHR